MNFRTPVSIDFYIKLNKKLNDWNFEDIVSFLKCIKLESLVSQIKDYEVTKGSEFFTLSESSTDFI